MKLESVTPNRKCDNCNQYAVTKLILEFAKGILLCDNCKEKMFDLVEGEINENKA